ncbi:MAG: hypothetical protein P1V35_10140, partial [Planctomycetota bacterium]|nr:hypothetical protein [Planctomycetota bacterium]
MSKQSDLIGRLTGRSLSIAGKISALVLILLSLGSASVILVLLDIQAASGVVAESNKLIGEQMEAVERQVE